MASLRGKIKCYPVFIVYNNARARRRRRREKNVVTKVLPFSFCLCEITGNIVLLLILSSVYETVTFFGLSKWVPFSCENLLNRLERLLHIVNSIIYVRMFTSFH